MWEGQGTPSPPGGQQAVEVEGRAGGSQPAQGRGWVASLDKAIMSEQLRTAQGSQTQVGPAHSSLATCTSWC